MSKKYISVAQVAKRLGVSTETVYNYCKQGILGGQYIKVNKKGTWKVDDSNTTKATYDSKSREYVFTNYSSGISIITMCFIGYKENKYCVQISQPAKDVSKNSSLTERILKSYTYYK